MNHMCFLRIYAELWQKQLTQEGGEQSMEEDLGWNEAVLLLMVPTSAKACAVA